jgi:hypothetical protein
MRDTALRRVSAASVRPTRDVEFEQWLVAREPALQTHRPPAHRRRPHGSGPPAGDPGRAVLRRISRSRSVGVTAPPPWTRRPDGRSGRRGPARRARAPDGVRRAPGRPLAASRSWTSGRARCSGAPFTPGAGSPTTAPTASPTPVTRAVSTWSMRWTAGGCGPCGSRRGCSASGGWRGTGTARCSSSRATRASRPASRASRGTTRVAVPRRRRHRSSASPRGNGSHACR